MQQFLVPQFIDVEDKILGPITTRQFVMMLIATLVTFVIYKLFSFMAFVLLGFLNMGLFAVLAFAKINGRPIHFFLLNFVQTIKKPNMRVWSREAYSRDVNIVGSEIRETKVVKERKETVSGSRLKDLTLVVNTGGVYEGSENTDIISTQ